MVGDIVADVEVPVSLLETSSTLEVASEASVSIEVVAVASIKVVDASVDCNNVPLASDVEVATVVSGVVEEATSGIGVETEVPPEVSFVDEATSPDATTSLEVAPMSVAVASEEVSDTDTEDAFGVEVPASKVCGAATSSIGVMTSVSGLGVATEVSADVFEGTVVVPTGPTESETDTVADVSIEVSLSAKACTGTNVNKKRDTKTKNSLVIPHVKRKWKNPCFTRQ
jgi:hypothetical protein